MDVASTPFGPISFSSVFILKTALFPGEPFPGAGPLCLFAREVCPCKFPFPQGWPFARVLSSLASVLGSLRRARWGSRRGGVEGGGAPAAPVGRDPRSHHRPLPVAGWGLGCQDTVLGLTLPGTGSLGSARCPLLPRWSLIAVSRPQLSPPPRDPCLPGPSSLWVLRAHSAELTPTQFIRGEIARGGHSASTALLGSPSRGPERWGPGAG